MTHVSHGLPGPTRLDAVHDVEGYRPGAAGLVDVAASRLHRAKVAQRHCVSPGKGCRLTGSNAALEFPDGTFEVSQVAQGAGGFMCEAAKLDWRTDYASLTYELVEVPIDVEKGVRLLMDELGLYFGALDFAVTPEGRWVFFEVNPNGQWHWLAVKAGVPMVEAMADALQGEDL